MPSTFVSALQDHMALMEALAAQEKTVEQAVSLMHRCLQQDGMVYIAGNGGSASDAQHFAAELTGRYEQDRPGYRSIALTTDTSALTAIGNDYGFDRLFARQLESLGRAGDLFIALSTSGNSANLVTAVQSAQNLGLQTISLTGRDGGKLARTTDCSIVVGGEKTSRIQEAHIFVLHYLCQTLEQRPW